MAVSSIPRLDHLSPGPIEIYEDHDEELPLDTPDLLDGDYSSSHHEDSVSDSDASGSPEPAFQTSQQQTSRHREVSAATAIHVTNPNDFDLDDDAFSDDEVRKVSDVFSTLSEEHDQNLPPTFYDVHKLQACTPTRLRSQRERSVFRSPSSVRALQMSSPHPFQPFSPSPGSDRYRRSGTPGTNVHHSRVGTPLQAPKPKKEYPLILLHVTVTLTSLQYSLESLVELLPPWVLENHALLHDKASDTVLERGILIAHPRDDYELLEERILESLELQLARIYKCGHFDAGALPGAQREISDEQHEDGTTGMEEAGMDDFKAHTCVDCGREVHSGAHGTSSGGTRRWDMKIYAANGLMRAGAWAAAWSEMEKVDLEIGVWIPEDSRALLEDRRKKEMQDALMQAEALQHQAQHVQDESTGGRDSVLDDVGSIASKYSSRSVSSQSRQRGEETMPLSTLLHNYLVRTARDGRNLVIFALVLILMVMSLPKDSSTPTAASIAQQEQQMCKSEQIQVLSTPLALPASVNTATSDAQHLSIAQTIASLSVQTSASRASEPEVSTVPEQITESQVELQRQPAEAMTVDDEQIRQLQEEHSEL